MKNKQHRKFIPFSHDNLELKNGLINYARDLRQKTGFENQIASTFIYISFVEYLANNLLQNLRYFTYLGSYNQYAGIIFIDERDSNKVKTLGQIIGEIDKFNFPDKVEVINLFSEVSTARNKIFHNFASVDLEGLEKILTDDLVAVQDKTEELLQKINVIYAGLQKILLQPQVEQKKDGTT